MTSININKLHYDVIFMDIQLQSDIPSTTTGIDIAKKLRLSGFNNDIIFITSYHEYVFEGYNVSAFNFLLKPIKKETLYPVLNSLIEKHIDKQYVLKTKQAIESIPYANIITITSKFVTIGLAAFLFLLNRLNATSIITLLITFIIQLLVCQFIYNTDFLKLFFWNSVYTLLTLLTDTLSINIPSTYNALR